MGFADPERLRPGITRRHVTEIAAEKFAELAKDLRAKGHDPQTVAHFVNRLVFCMFAEDIGLLPNAMFTRMLKEAHRAPAEFETLCRALFGAMQTDGRLGFERVEWFDGGLFDDDTALPLSKVEIERALDAADMDWSQIDPSIMGTLFERGLDPDKRSQLGAHYTDADKIMKIIEPVIKRPLEAEWVEVRGKIDAAIFKMENARRLRPATMADARKVHRIARQAEEKFHREAQRLAEAFLARLRGFRVLDPACGSGNFLYLALQTLKDLEQRVLIELEAIGLGRGVPMVGPEQLLGIEINPYAAELARVSVWIGEIQWMQRHGFGIARNPILRPLDTIECRDAILNPDGTEAKWPAAEVIIGNPPFLGGKLLMRHLDEAYVHRLFQIYDGSVRPEADLVCYWFAKAQDQTEAGKTTRAGLVATNSIRGGANRRVLDRVRKHGAIFEAWDDEPWVVEGADVRVSLVCFGRPDLAGGTPCLDGEPVAEIFSDLSARRGTVGVDLTKARRLPENAGVAFMGDSKGGPFDISGDLAREWLAAPMNPNGRSNSDVLKRWAHGSDVNHRLGDNWIIDFGWKLDEEQAAFFEKPFEFALKYISHYVAIIDGLRTSYSGGAMWSRGKACGARSKADVDMSRPPDTRNTEFSFGCLLKLSLTVR
jgi:type II restriction/modification system DNA methylase subunit YeeA